MPLHLVSQIAPTFDESRGMLGAWARVPDVVGPVEGVRVFVTLDALWTMEPSAVRDLSSALAIFGKRKGRVQLAASMKFDHSGPEEDDRHDGRPVIVLTTYDFDMLPSDKPLR